MAITYLGTKRLQGLKVDRVSDSLGSNGDGINSGVTSVEPATGGTDLTSSSQSYTQVGTTVVKTNDTITATATSASSGGDGTQRVYTTLPSTLSNTKHTTDFDLKITANASSGDPDVTPIMYTAGTDPFHTGNSQDGFGCDMYSDSGNGNNYVMRAIEKNGTDNDYSGGIVLTPQTQYYCRLKRNSSTVGTMEVYTDSARTTHASGSPQTLSITDGTGGEDCTHLQSGAWSQSGSTSYKVENVKLYNDKLVGDTKLGSGAYSFDGTNDSITFGSASDWEFLSDGSSWSIAWWQKCNAIGVTEQIFNTHDDSSGSNKGMGIYQHSSNKIGLSTYNGTAGQYPFSHEIVSGFWADTNWHHIAVVYDSSDEKAHIYKDGSLKISQSKNSASFVAGAPQGALKMGERVSANNRDLNSSIDDVGIYSRALTATEISKLANNNNDGSTGWTSSDTDFLKVNSGALTWTDGGTYNYQVMSYDLGSALSNTQWTMRFKANFSGSASSDDPLFGFVLSSTASNTFNTTCDVIGAGWYNDRNNSWSRIYSVSKENASGAGLSNSSPQYNDYTKGTDYYIQVERTSATAAAVKIYTNSDYSTGQVGSTIVMNNISSSLTGLRYLNAQHHAQGNGMTGTVDDVKIWDGTNTTSGTPDHSFTFTAGDAQSVSSLSNKAGLKAHYTMDSASKPLPTATMSEDFSSSSAWTLHSSSSISGGSLTCNNTGESYRSTGLGKPTNLTWDFTWTRNSGDAGNTSALLLTSHTGGYNDPSSGHTNVQFYMANGNVTTLSVRKNSGSGNVQTECHFGVGSSSVNIQPTGTTRYYRITKNGSVWTMKKFTSASDRTNDTNAEASATATQSSTADSTWNSGSGNLTYLLVDGHGSGTKNYTIDDVAVYEGTTEGCQNNASATSELDGVNAEVNTIFEQTDDTPNYYWKQSDGTWALSGIPTARAWWDMSASDTTVSNVTDKTGNGFSLKQATSSKQPSIVTSAQNGLNALSFTKDDDFMLTENNFRGELQQTIICVFKVTKETANGWQYYLWDGAAAFNAVSQYGDNWRISADGNVDSSETSWDRWLVFTAQFNGSSSFIRDNGTQTAINSTSESEHVNNGFTLNGYSGRSGSDAGRYGGNVDWGECIVYNRLLDSSEINRVEKYLKDKWGTP